MTVTIYRNDSPSVYLNKSVTQLWTGTGTARDSISLLEPTIMIEADLAPYLNRMNYMFIDDFSRFYFIKKVVMAKYGLYAVSGYVDALMSWKNEILECNAVVSRQENLFNLYLNDGVFKAQQNPLIQRLEYPTGFPDREIVMVIAGPIGQS